MLTIKQAKKQLAHYKRLMPDRWTIMRPEVALKSIRREEGPIFFSFSRQGEKRVGRITVEQLAVMAEVKTAILTARAATKTSS